MSLPIEGVVHESARQQVTMHRVEGGIWIALGVLFTVLCVFVEGRADEENLRLGAGIGGILFVVAGSIYIAKMSARVRTLVTLLLHHRSELKEPVVIFIRVRGVVARYAITVRDAKNRSYRMRVPSEDAARAMLAGIPR